jgi:hypothetical protein
MAAYNISADQLMKFRMQGHLPGGEQ